MAKENFEIITKAVESFATKISGATAAVRYFTPSVASFTSSHDEHPRIAADKREALAICQRILSPVLKAHRAALDELIGTIECTWKPPTN